MTLDEHYQLACTQPSDIRSHVETLAYYAALVPATQNIIELGFRTGVSTWGLLKGSNGAKVISYDISKTCIAVDHLAACPDNFQLRVRDSRLPLDTNVGLLFLDTLHTYMQLKDELGVWNKRLAPKAYVAFHDTELPEVKMGIDYFRQIAVVTQVHESFDDHGLIVLQLAK